jgi:hypothetical protein
MGSISDFLENELLDHCFNAAWASPTTVFLGLSTADPLDTGAGLAEPSGGAYSRVTITFVTAVTRNVTQKAKVTFPQATNAWGDITHYSVHDAVSGGNFLAHGSLNTTKGVVNGNTPSVATSEVVISYTAGETSDYLAHKLLDHAFRNKQYTFQSTFAIALCTGNILDTDTSIIHAQRFLKMREPRRIGILPRAVPLTIPMQLRLQRHRDPGEPLPQSELSMRRRPAICYGTKTP